MIRENVNSLGYNLTKEVPATVDEYNGLAPKRTNPCLEDANRNTLYRSVYPTFRSTFLDAVEKETGVSRINEGTEEDPKWEKEGAYHNRVIATLVAQGSTEESVRARLLPFAQKAMDDAEFSPAESESTAQGPAAGKGDIKTAEQIEKDGKLEAVAGKLSAILNRVVTSDVKSVARALADNRKALAAKAAEEQKAALGL